MCRLFAQISPTIASASDFLVRKELSLLRQSHCNPKGLQKDGWGLGHWNAREGGWTLVKSPGAAFRQKARFRAAARAARSQFVVAHIRHASNPKKLPKEKILGLENTQPFVHRNLIFAHNGTLNIPDEVARALGAYRKRLRGHNDSEVLFWLFVKTWNDLKGERNRWHKTFAAMTRQIDRVWERLPKAKRKHAASSSGLNFLASDGQTLAAHCFYGRADGKSLCGQGRPYFEMCYNIGNGRIAVASEPMDQAGRWRPIPNRHVLVAQPSGAYLLSKLI